MSLISIVVPTHNELSNVALLHRRVAEVFAGLPGDDFELIFCDDSTDATPQAIADLRAGDKRVKLVRLSRRYGQALAITAGLDRASGEAVVMMDADLQDPPETIGLLLERWRAGHEVVYVQRASAGSKLYKTLSRIFYRLLRRIASVEIPVDASEFRLLDRKVVEYLRRLTEQTRYLRGLTVLPGFRQTSIHITRAPRLHGQTNYNLKRSMRVALDGILSFSTAPLRIATVLGVLTMGAAFAVAIGYGVWKLADPEIVGPLWPGLFVTLLLFGGMQFLLLGILGEYVARIMTEVQNRPVYWVDYELGFDEADATARTQSGQRNPLQ